MCASFWGGSTWETHTFVVTEKLPAWAQCLASRRMEVCIMVWRFGNHLGLVWGLLISLEVSVLTFCALRNIPSGSPALDPAEHPEELITCLNCTRHTLDFLRSFLLL